MYSYRYEIESSFGTDTSKNFVTDIVSGNVIESEDPNCIYPVLQIFKSKGKISIWSFSLADTQETYVFYVPEGTISKEVNLK